MNNRLGEFSFSFSGEFLDRENWDSSRIEHSNGWFGFQVAEERYSKLKLDYSKTESVNLLEIYRNASMKMQSEQGSSKGIDYSLAKSFRRMGEIYYYLNDKEKAIEYLEKALEINPKVGAKKLLRRVKE
jgi:tetratricopeptide (TPR) repeat protein